MFKTAGALGILAVTLAASPAPTRQDVMNFRFNAHEAGCLTRGAQALGRDNSIRILPDPQHPGRGMILQVDRRGFQTLIRELAATNRTCIEQLIYLLTPDDQQTPQTAEALKNAQRGEDRGLWSLPLNLFR